MSSTATGSSFVEEPFSRTKASVAKHEGQRQGGEAPGDEERADRPEQHRREHGAGDREEAGPHVSTKNTPPTASAASKELKPQSPL